MIAAPSRLAIALVSMEGPDEYSQAGGLGVRMAQMARALADLDFQPTLFFVGDPALPRQESWSGVHLHRLAQGLSAEFPAGVYAGEELKRTYLQARFPQWLVSGWVLSQLDRGLTPVIFFEEWQTAAWARQTSELLLRAGVRERCLVLWNANNQFGFDQLDWIGLAESTAVTTVSRYMRLLLQRRGVDPVVIPNGIPEDRLAPPDPGAVAALRAAAEPKQLLLKVGRFHADKRWIQAVRGLAALRRLQRPVRMLVRGAGEPYGATVMAEARRLGLRVECWEEPIPDLPALTRAIQSTPEADLLDFRRFLPEPLLAPLYASALAVLANSGFEPFGLVGLEAMAAGGVAVVGATGEDYARHLHNSLVIETQDPEELAAAIATLEADPDRTNSLRLAARATAATYAWPVVINGDLLPRVPLLFKLQRARWSDSELGG